jgi:hypothetical protein
MKIVGATFVKDGQAKRARARICAEIALANEPQIARAEEPGRGEAGVSLLGVRVPEDCVGRVRAIIEAAGGEVESEVPETEIE